MNKSIEGRTSIGMIADSDTIRAFGLAGLTNTSKGDNMVSVDHNVSRSDMENIFKKMVSRADIGIIFIAEFVEQKIPEVINEYKNTLPYCMIFKSMLGPIRQRNLMSDE